MPNFRLRLSNAGNVSDLRAAGLERALAALQASGQRVGLRHLLKSWQQTRAYALHLQAETAEAYEEQLAHKAQKVAKMFSDIFPGSLEVYRSPHEHYRLRAEFRIWHDGPKSHYVVYEKAGKSLQRTYVTSFPSASLLVNELMAALMREVHTQPALREKLYQVNFHTTLDGDAMVTLIYKKALGDSWAEAATALRSRLGQVPSCTRVQPAIVGRSRGQKLTLGQDYVVERMRVAGRVLEYLQPEGAFSQPNGHVCQHMLAWAHAVTAESVGDLAELYCGNGNFTAAVAGNFRRVFATEVAKASVCAAERNMQANGINNVLVARLSASEFTEAWHGKRTFHRLNGIDLAAFKLKTLLIDPPRAGLDGISIALLPQFQNIVYISCNPESLRANLCQVAGSHSVARMAIFDQFPFTKHVECGVYLQRHDHNMGGETPLPT